MKAGGRKGIDPSVIVIGAVVAVALVGILLMSGGRGDDLPRSRVGFSGLIAWLGEAGADAREFRGGSRPSRAQVGLRIWPLHDDDLGESRPEPETDLDYVLQTAELDQSMSVLRDKIERLDTLLVMPKWRTGMRLSGVAHETLLIPEATLSALARRIGTGPLSRKAGIARFAYPGEGGLEAVIWAPQTVSAGSDCRPLIGTADAMLLGTCLSGDVEFLFLADPDLLNNQGLALGDNAEIARDLILTRAETLPVLYDTTQEIWALDPNATRDSPDPVEPPRIFAWPLVVVWMAFLALAGLVAWRALVRYGPPLPDGPPGLGASKAVSIAAKGRLLRLAGHDAKLVASWAAARCQDLAAELFGAHRDTAEEPVRAVARALERRAPEIGREFAAAAEALTRDTHAGAADLLRRLDRFETVLERVLNEFGRSSGPRR